MGFFNSLDQIDDAVDRGYARWGKWVWGALLLPLVIYFCWSVWAAIWGSPSGAVKLVIHNELDRPVLEFTVNGVAGANAFAHGGGKVTCCGSISGDKAEVIWTLDITHEQYLKGMRLETRRKETTIPARQWVENFLHVYFLPDDEILLWWSTGLGHPDSQDIKGHASKLKRNN